MRDVYLVTGGAGFIGANFVAYCLERTEHDIVVLDKLTYAGNLGNLEKWLDNTRFKFVHGDIADEELVESLLHEHKPASVVNFAAESHVDRSILGPEPFIDTNVIGTMRILRAAVTFFNTLSGLSRDRFRFLQVSTDEVFGSLELGDSSFDESSKYAPNSPYAASKAAADHLVRAWHKTYGLPVLTTNCSNNFGPMQFPEKLIPLVILRALAGEEVPVYGDGLYRRDWLYVLDHCRAIEQVLNRGRVGGVYIVGGGTELSNLEVVGLICRKLDEIRPRADGNSHSNLIRFVDDRPGHDRRYSVDASLLERELGWRAEVTFPEGIERTVNWYMNNTAWVDRVQSGSYRAWLYENYSHRGVLE